MEENKNNDDGMVHDKGLPPRPRNNIYPFQYQLADGYEDSIKTGKMWEKYNGLIAQLQLSGATLQDRSDVERDYIKKDIDILGQMYFNSYINYPTYLASIYNIILAFNIIRANWQQQHPPVPQEEQIPTEQLKTTEPPV